MDKQIFTLNSHNRLQNKLSEGQRILQKLRDAFIIYEHFDEIYHYFCEEYKKKHLCSIRIVIQSKEMQSNIEKALVKDIYKIIITDIKMDAYLVLKREAEKGQDIPIQQKLVASNCLIKLDRSGTILVYSTKQTQIIEDQNIDDDLDFDDIETEETYDFNQQTEQSFEHTDPMHEISIGRNDSSIMSEYELNDFDDDKIAESDQLKERGLLEKIKEIETQSEKPLSSFKKVEEETSAFIDPSLVTSISE